MPGDIETMLNELSVAQARMGEQIKTLFTRQESITKLTETVHSLALSIERQGLSLEATTAKVDGLKTDVDEIKSKPAKRWDTVISVVITAVVTAAITFFLTKAGL